MEKLLNSQKKNDYSVLVISTVTACSNILDFINTSKFQPIRNLLIVGYIHKYTLEIFSIYAWKQKY